MMQLGTSSSDHVNDNPPKSEDTPGSSFSTNDLSMDKHVKRLFQAAMSGDVSKLNDETKNRLKQDPKIVLEQTPEGNTCLHISLSFGHQNFLKDIFEIIFGHEEGSSERIKLLKSLLSCINSNKETPLIVAVKSTHVFYQRKKSWSWLLSRKKAGHFSLASPLLKMYQNLNIRAAILEPDFNEDNALHHAVRHGHEELALKLIEAEPNLSKAVNKYNESPMYIAVMRGFNSVLYKLLEDDDFSHVGAYNDNALHAAVRNANKDIIEEIMKKRPHLAKEENTSGVTPIQYAVHRNQTNVIGKLLERDRSLGYLVNKIQDPLLICAASRGNVEVAEEILKHCPDAPYRNGAGLTILHQAVVDGYVKFVEFILQKHQLDKLINMRDNAGYTALHYAVKKCNPKIVRALLAHKEIDVRIYDSKGRPAFWQLIEAPDSAKSLNWNEVFMLMAVADAQATTYYLRQVAMNNITAKSMQEIKSLTGRYTKNTSLVAILIATITFAAAFTLPGGYSSKDTAEGVPVMAKKYAFKAFLISDTLAMCSSLAVAFLCILARWEDLKFLLYYRLVTQYLMWFALMATNVAFATGLYTVVAPRVLWLAILICVLSISLPFFTYLLGQWPILMLRYRLGSAFKANLLDMV